MKHTIFTLPVVTVLLGGSAVAAPISATSELEMYHRYTVNSGSVPTGLRINSLASSLVLNSNTTSSIDDPAAISTNTPFTQVGNPFTDPATPFIAQSTDETTLNAGTEGSEASFDMQITSVDDPDANPFDTSIIDREVDASGEALAQITSAPIGAAANSSFIVERGYNFENESDDTVSFNIVGTVTARFFASYDGLDGFARASGNLSLEFADQVGTSIQFLPTGAYSLVIEDDDPGAFVTENLVTSSGAFDGFNFAAAASATGDGGQTDASFDGSFRYLFRVEMDAGASFNLITAAGQANGVLYDPVIAPVPLPASLSFIGLALAGLAAMKRTSKKRLSFGRGFVAS